MGLSDTFLDNVRDMVDSWVDYEESHVDAGDNYSHLAGEGVFDYNNGEQQLIDYCESVGIDLSGVEIDRLASDVIFWGYMTKGEAFDVQERFLVASYQVGEIELQVEAESIGARFTPYLIDQLNRETDAYWRQGSDSIAYAYVISESYWDHVCDLDTIRDLVDQHKEER